MLQHLSLIWPAPAGGAIFLSLPGLGNFCNALRDGREEIVRCIKRQKYKEVPIDVRERNAGL